MPQQNHAQQRAALEIEGRARFDAADAVAFSRAGIRRERAQVDFDEFE